MNRRRFPATAVSAGFCSGKAAAQRSTKAFRVGWLTGQHSSSLSPFVAAFRSSLVDLGDDEGRNIHIEFRFGDDDIELVPRLAHELERLPVDVIVAQGVATTAVSKLELGVPVVFVYSGDPVSAGLADSLAHPLRNLTGVTFMAAELNGKRLQLMQEVKPDLRRVALVANSSHAGEHLERAYSEETGHRLGIEIGYFPTRNSVGLAAALDAMAKRSPEATLLFPDGFAIQNRKTIVDFGLRHGAPVISGWRVFAESGALISYGPRLIESDRRLAHYVDRILKVARPADLPIERPTSFELLLNLRTAKSLRLEIPPTLLPQADEVIE